MSANHSFLVRLVGRRGTTLLLLAFLYLAIGYGVLTAESQGKSAAYTGQAALFPLWIWAVMWWWTALVLCVSAFIRHDAIGFSIATGMTVFWSLSFWNSFLIYDQNRAWISGLTWMAIALWLRVVAAWPEERVYGSP